MVVLPVARRIYLLAVIGRLCYRPLRRPLPSRTVIRSILWGSRWILSIVPYNSLKSPPHPAGQRAKLVSWFLHWKNGRKMGCANYPL